MVLDRESGPYETRYNFMGKAWSRNSVVQQPEYYRFTTAVIEPVKVTIVTHLHNI